MKQLAGTTKNQKYEQLDRQPSSMTKAGRSLGNMDLSPVGSERGTLTDYKKRKNSENLMTEGASSTQTISNQFIFGGKQNFDTHDYSQMDPMQDITGNMMMMDTSMETG